MADAGAPWWPVAGGSRLRVRLTPKSSCDAVEGIEATADGPALKARVRDISENGEANAAVEALVAAWNGIPKGRVSMVAGHKSRVKTLQFDGAKDDLVQRIVTSLSVTADDKTSRKCGAI